MTRSDCMWLDLRRSQDRITFWRNVASARLLDTTCQLSLSVLPCRWCILFHVRSVPQIPRIPRFLGRSVGLIRLLCLGGETPGATTPGAYTPIAFTPTGYTPGSYTSDAQRLILRCFSFQAALLRPGGPIRRPGLQTTCKKQS